MHIFYKIQSKLVFIKYLKYFIKIELIYQIHINLINMDSIYFPEIISYIINFLEKDSIKKFCCVFKDQKFIKECLKYTRIPKLVKCKWTINNGIKSFRETVYNTNLDRVSDICIDLCINKKREYYRRRRTINFENNKIIKLHIDLNNHDGNNGSFIEKIKSTTLTKLTLVYCQIGEDFLENLKENCPNIKVINFIYVKTNNGIITKKILI